MKKVRNPYVLCPNKRRLNKSRLDEHDSESSLAGMMLLCCITLMGCSKQKTEVEQEVPFGDGDPAQQFTS